MVVSEISKFEDGLSRWITDLKDFKPVSAQSTSFVTNYIKVLSYVRDCGFYKKEALQNWCKYDIADPWLIAVAMEIGATIITGEISAGGLSVKNKSKNAKIPDVANNFGIKYENLFYFMRQMKFKL